MVNKASMYWSLPARGEHGEEGAGSVDFLMTDPAAVKILKVERGVPAIPAVSPNRAGARCDRQDNRDVRSGPAGRGGPAAVTPQNASGYSGEVTRIGTDVLFDRKTPGRRRAGVAGGDRRKQPAESVT